MNSLDMKNCSLCPRRCLAERTKGVGVCGAGEKIRAARASLHMWEEPCISGNFGSGTIFFSGCPLKCVFCQNSELSLECKGKDIDINRLCEIFFELEEKGAKNINLVSPTPFIPSISKAIIKAKSSNFKLPFVFNSSGYELADTLRQLDGLIDIYLPDFKYMSDRLAIKYSKAEDYAKYAKSAIDEMVRQQPTPTFDTNDMMTKGTIVRHLILPGCTEDSKKIISYLHKRYKDKIFISIMSQYTPHGKLDLHPELKRKITQDEYDDVVDFALGIGVTQGFIQDGESAEESFIPVFDNRGI